MPRAPCARTSRGKSSSPFVSSRGTVSLPRADTRPASRPPRPRTTTWPPPSRPPIFRSLWREPSSSSRYSQARPVASTCTTRPPHSTTRSGGRRQRARPISRRCWSPRPRATMTSPRCSKPRSAYATQLSGRGRPLYTSVRAPRRPDPRVIRAMPTPSMPSSWHGQRHATSVVCRRHAPPARTATRDTRSRMRTVR
jgi:hypothetical protein